MFERWTERARQIVVMAQEEARETHNYIGWPQILIGVINENNGIAAKILRERGITAKDVRSAMGVGDQVFDDKQIPFTPEAKQTCERALREALALGHNYIAPEHVLLGILSIDGMTTLLASMYGITADDLRGDIRRAIGQDNLTKRGEIPAVPKSPQQQILAELVKQTELLEQLVTLMREVYGR